MRITWIRHFAAVKIHRKPTTTHKKNVKAHASELARLSRGLLGGFIEDISTPQTR